MKHISVLALVFSAHLARSAPIGAVVQTWHHAVKRIFFALLLVLLPIVPANAQHDNHQHAAVTHTENMIDGHDHPELVPDSMAYQLYLLSISVPINATEQDRKVQASHIAKIKLDAEDTQSLTIAAATFRIQYDAWVSKYNAEAEAQGAAFDPTNLLQQRDDFVRSFQDVLKNALSSRGASKLHEHIQQEKRFMKVSAN